VADRASTYMGPRSPYGYWGKPTFEKTMSGQIVERPNWEIYPDAIVQAIRAGAPGPKHGSWDYKEPASLEQALADQGFDLSEKELSGAFELESQGQSPEETNVGSGVTGAAAPSPKPLPIRSTYDPLPISNQRTPLSQGSQFPQFTNPQRPGGSFYTSRGTVFGAQSPLDAGDSLTKGQNFLDKWSNLFDRANAVEQAPMPDVNLLTVGDLSDYLGDLPKARGPNVGLTLDPGAKGKRRTQIRQITRGPKKTDQFQSELFGFLRGITNTPFGDVSAQLSFGNRPGKMDFDEDKEFTNDFGSASASLIGGQNSPPMFNVTDSDLKKES
jgi:hypothetical protein